MRHDAHYVETLTSFAARRLPHDSTDKIRPNRTARKNIGDIRELTDSIREKGVLEPLLVRTFRGRIPTT